MTEGQDQQPRQRTIQLDALAGYYRDKAQVTETLAVQLADQLRSAIAAGNALDVDNKRLEIRIVALEGELAEQTREIARLQATVPPEPG